MRVLLIYNPTAGEEDVEPTGLVSILREAGHAVDPLSINAEWEDALGGLPPISRVHNVCGQDT